MRRHQRKGAGPTTRLLLDGISRAGVAGGSLLDIGGGVGALTFDLLARGFDRAVIVEASAGYTAAASSEAVRRGRSPQAEFVDYLDVAGTVSRASVVAVDRVACCYPLYEELLTEAIRRAERAFAFSYPERALVRPSRNAVGECTPVTQDRLSDVCPSRNDDARAARGPDPTWSSSDEPLSGRGCVRSSYVNDINCPCTMTYPGIENVEMELSTLSVAVRGGTIWTTDAPGVLRRRRVARSLECGLTRLLAGARHELERIVVTNLPIAVH